MNQVKISGLVMKTPGLFRAIIIFSVTLCNVQLISAEGTNDNLLRKTFLSAEAQSGQPNSPEYQRLYNQLYFYPLQPYLDQKRLISQMSMTKVGEIDAFLDKYEKTPLDWPLRKQWLDYLAARKQQTLYLKYFRSNNDAELTCQYYQFQLASGLPASEVLPKVTGLWQVGRSQPKVCDKLFAQWQQAGYRTNEIIWQRIRLAADGGDHTLIPYLTTLLPESEQYLATLWRRVRIDPAYIINLSRFPQKSLKETEILSYGLQRLIWRKPDIALALYEKITAKFALSIPQQQQITAKFALALASKNHQSAKIWLTAVDESLLTGDLLQWLLVDILKSDDWTATKSALQTMPALYQKDMQWQYWYAKSLIATDEKLAGESILQGLAQQRHYYGFLAASLLNVPVNLQDEPLEISVNEKTIFDNPAAKRAFELFHLNREEQARREWHYWLSQLNDREKLVAAKIANEQQWFDRAIFTLAEVGYLNDVDLRFPLAFSDEILHYSHVNKVEPSWVFAITRRESSFMIDANSHAGAHGLMQVLPSTAKQLQRTSLPRHFLMNAENNINVGTRYLHNLLADHRGNSVLATAAYNAGPYRVSRWLKNITHIPADMWIETIPFKETRDYVKSVLAYRQIYQQKVGSEQFVFDDLITMQIGDEN